MTEHSYLSEEERRATEELKQDAIRLTKRNTAILKVILRLEESLKENEKLRQRIEELEQR